MQSWALQQLWGALSTQPGIMVLEVLVGRACPCMGDGVCETGVLQHLVMQRLPMRGCNCAAGMHCRAGMKVEVLDTMPALQSQITCLPKQVSLLTYARP